MDAIEQKTSEKKEKGYAPTVIRYTVYVNKYQHTHTYIYIYLFFKKICVCMFLRSSYAYLYNSRPLKLDPPWSDSHRRRSRVALPASSSGCGSWSGLSAKPRAGAGWTSAGTTTQGRFHGGWHGWLPNSATASSVWERTKRKPRPGSAAGARDDHQPA